MNILWCFVLGKELQLKWRSLRDAFVRNNRASKKTKSGDPATNPKKYIYARQLEFLLQVPSSNETEDSLEQKSLEGTERIQEGSERAQDFNYRQIHDEPSASTVYRKSKKNLDEKLGKYMEVMSKQCESSISQQKDDDYNFLLSILPIIKKLSDAEKLQCRCDIMQILMKYTAQSQVRVQPTAANIYFPIHQNSTRYFDPGMSSFTHEQNLVYNQPHGMVHQMEYQTPGQTATFTSKSQKTPAPSTVLPQSTSWNEKSSTPKHLSTYVDTTPRCKRQKKDDLGTARETTTCSDYIVEETCTFDEEQDIFSPLSVGSESNNDSLLSL